MFHKNLEIEPLYGLGIPLLGKHPKGYRDTSTINTFIFTVVKKWKQPSVYQQKYK